MLRMEQALEQILAEARPVGAEEVDLTHALGRFLAEDVYADIDLPPFDNSAVDGYAVRAADTRGAAHEAPVILREVGDVPAGRTPEGSVAPGTACRIMTGAPIPDGADAVVMIEDVRQGPDAGSVSVLEAAAPEQHIRRAGEDLRRGAQVLDTAMRIRPAEVAMLATMGRARVRVGRVPRVAVFSTGDELVEISSVPPTRGKIRDSNRYSLAALVQEAGAEVHSIAHLEDDPAAIERALRAAADPDGGADVIVTAGGVSMGDRDYVRPAMEKLGALSLWKVAIKPGKPLAFGRIGRTLFFGLPGNPISAMVTFELFARPALLRMAGAADANLNRPSVRATMEHSLPHVPGRREYVRGVVRWQPGGYVASASEKQGSSMLQSAVAANAFLVIPEEATEIPAGGGVEALLLD